jgi:radical SAM superfamily enzyme
MLISQADTINSLPLVTVKFHQLQIFRNTPMAAEYERHPERFTFRGMEEYIDFFIAILRRLRPTLVVERFAGEAPPRHRVGAGWGLVRNEELAARLDGRLSELDVRQGDLYNG